jgi:hypothetical protein
MTAGEVIKQIEGWGLLTNPDYGITEDITPAQGCTSETCQHLSHDPAAPVRAWRPKEGPVIFLVESRLDGATHEWYYIPAEGRVIHVERPTHYWAELTRDYDPPVFVLRVLRELGLLDAFEAPTSHWAEREGAVR